jgi:signal transduction histidine kinase
MGERPQASRILVCDDDEAGRAALAEVVRAAGYRVDEARTGAECLDVVAAEAPHLIVLDVSMPDLDGFEVLRRLRGGRHRDVPVVLLTGARFDPDSIGSGLELGADEYLRKPVRPAELLARIRALVKLAAARRELERMKREQTAMLVHDLKQPLAIIALRAEFVADEGADPEVRRSGLAIREACRQMERLVESVLELSRLEAGHLRLDRAPHRIDDLVAEVADQLRGLAARRGLVLESHARTGRSGALAGFQALVDRDKVVQVVQNLIGNALKFTPAGGRIDVHCTVSEGELEIAVEDTGCGLAPDEVARIFDRWHQTRAGRAQGGSGLGLAIARAIVEAHGGRIGAGPRVDGARGARFWFTLPAATTTAPAASAASGDVTVEPTRQIV